MLFVVIYGVALSVCWVLDGLWGVASIAWLVALGVWWISWLVRGSGWYDIVVLVGLVVLLGLDFAV